MLDRINVAKVTQVQQKEFESVAHRLMSLPLGFSAIIQAPGTNLYVNADGVEIADGDILLQCLTRKTIACGPAKIMCSKGAVVSVDNSNYITHIRALSGPGDTTIVIGSRKVVLHPGQELAISKSGELNDLYSDSIGRRRISRLSPKGSGAVGLAEFSPISLITAKQHIRDLMHSSHPTNRKLLDRILKLQASLALSQSKHGSYSTAPILSFDKDQRD